MTHERARPRSSGFTHRQRLIGAVLLSILLSACRSEQSNLPPAEDLPPDQALFVSIVADAQNKAASTANDMQLASIKRERDELICERIAGLSGSWWANSDPMSAMPMMGTSRYFVRNWVGRVITVDATGDGFGIVVVEIAERVRVATSNNTISDVGYDTLIKQASPMFGQAVALTEGQLVLLSGSFLGGIDGDCFYDASFTLRGGLVDPEFVFRFSSLLPYIPADSVTSSKPSETASSTNDPAIEISPATPIQESVIGMPVESEIAEPKIGDYERAPSRPSFDCGKASTLVENVICADEQLARLDAALAKNYSSIRGSNIGDDTRSNLRVTQRQWMRDRNQCADAACIEKSYRERIEEVCAVPVLSGVHPGCVEVSMTQ